MERDAMSEVVTFSVRGRGKIRSGPVVMTPTRHTQEIVPPMLEYRTCSAPDCNRLIKARGFCSYHYRRFRASGDLIVMHPWSSPRPAAERFWDRVEITETCWLWRGGINDAGYGRFEGNGRAHRFSFNLLRGPIPQGATLDHLCRVRSCVNPDHLEPVTNTENVMRGTGFAPQNAAKTHCPRGHALVEGNIRYRKEGRWRECLTCHNSRYRRK